MAAPDRRDGGSVRGRGERGTRVGRNTSQARLRNGLAVARFGDPVLPGNEVLLRWTRSDADQMPRSFQAQGLDRGDGMVGLATDEVADAGGAGSDDSGRRIGNCVRKVTSGPGVSSGSVES